MDDPTGIEMNIPKKAQSVQKRPSKIEIIAAALGLYVLMSILDPWIAMPMRAGSSWTAFALLRAMGLPFELQGVVLTAPNFVFEVIPACSGSTTLRVLVFLGTLWMWTRPGWTVTRKCIGVLFAIPTALTANAIRLTWLAGFGYWRGEPLEGLAHEWTGLIAFTFGAVGLIWISEMLRSRSSGKASSQGASGNSGKSNKSGIPVWIGILLVLGVTYSNLGIWVYLGWKNSPLDRLGWMISLSGLSAATIFILWCEKRITKPIWQISSVLFHVSSLILYFTLFALAQIGGINILTGASFCLLAIIITQARYGWAAVHTMIPLAAWIFVGFPTIPYILNQALSRVFSISAGKTTGIWAQFLMAGAVALVSCIGFLKTRKQSQSLNDTDGSVPEPTHSVVASVSTTTRTSSEGHFWRNAIALWLLLSWAGKTAYNDFGRHDPLPSKLKISFQLGNWRGFNQAPPNKLPGWELGKNYWSRVYEPSSSSVSSSSSFSGSEIDSDASSSSGSQVGLLISSSEGDRHNLHPPEYCFTGSGWKIIQTQQKDLQFSQAGLHTVTQIITQRGNSKLNGYYWYTDGKVYLPSYPAVIIEEMKRRAMGERTNWYFFRILAPDLETLHDTFWPEFTGSIDVEGTTHNW